MICALNRNLLRSSSCGYSLPEIVDLYIINYSDLSGVPAISTDAEGCEEVTAITLNTGKEVYHVEPAKNSASFEDTLVVPDGGSPYRNASITFNVSGMYDACQHAALDALSLGRFTLVVKTADGNYLMFGRIAPLEAETASLVGGSDQNGLQFVISGNIAESPMPLSDEAVTQLLAKVHVDD